MANESSVMAGFSARFQKCWICGQRGTDARPLQIHHICRGPHRKAAREAECSLIRTCGNCHSTQLDSMPIDWQLALVAIYNPSAYDRALVNTLRHRAPDAVDERLVIMAMKGWFNRKGLYP